MSTDATLPSYERPEVRAIAPQLKLVRDLLGGTPSMHAASPDYIFKWPGEETAVYDFRRRIETVFEGFGRTLSAATGMLYAKPPAINWNASETAISPHYDNLDAAGTKGSVLLKRYAESCLADGLGAIVVDHPPPPNLTDDDGKARTPRGDEEAAFGLRPTWALYDRSQIINWRHTVINNAAALQMIMFRTTADVDDGAYGVKTVYRFRELRLVLTPLGYQATWRLWESDSATAEKLEEFRSVGGGVFQNRDGKIADFLPVSIAYTGRTKAPLTATVPLIGVAWANLAHWQLSTALRFYRELSAYPQPVVTGQIAPDPATGIAGKFRVGPMVVVHLLDGGTFQWAELDGSSMEQLEHGIVEKLGQMSMLGMSFLQKETKGVETAEATRLQATAENSTLATAAQGIEDAANLAMEHHAWYLGIAKKDAPVLSLSKDFESNVLDAQVMVAYVTAVEKAKLPVRVLLQAWQDGGRLPPDVDIEELGAQMDAARDADDDEKQRILADALAAQKERRAA